MHVLFVEPAFPYNQREFVRGLVSAGATVTGIGERPLDFLDDELKGWLSEHYAEPATLEDLADAVSSSPFHVHRVFRAQTGFTLHEYRNQLRLRTGYGDVRHVNRRVRKHACCSDVFRVAIDVCRGAELRDAAIFH